MRTVVDGGRFPGTAAGTAGATAAIEATVVFVFVVDGVKVSFLRDTSLFSPTTMCTSVSGAVADAVVAEASFVNADGFVVVIVAIKDGIETKAAFLPTVYSGLSS